MSEDEVDAIRQESGLPGLPCLPSGDWLERNVAADFAVLLVSYQEAAQTLLKAAEDGSLESVLRKKTGEEALAKRICAVELDMLV